MYITYLPKNVPRNCCVRIIFCSTCGVEGNWEHIYRHKPQIMIKVLIWLMRISGKPGTTIFFIEAIQNIFPLKYPENWLCSNNIVFEMWCWRKLRTHLSTSAADEWWKRTWVESLWGPPLQKVTFLQYLVILIEIIEKKFSWLLETAIQKIVKLLYQFVKSTRILNLPSCKSGFYISLDVIHSWADFIGSCSPSAYVIIFQLLR